MSSIVGSGTQKKANELKNTKHFFDVFIAYLENLIDSEELKKGSAKQYISKIIQILKYFDDDKDFHNIKIDDIISYAEEEGKTIDDGFKAALRYFVLSTQENILFSITVDELENLETQKKKSRDATPLSIQEIIKIRNELEVKNQYSYSFIFEMFFTYGIKVGEFEKLKRQQFSLEKLTFTDKEESTRQLSKNIETLLKSHGDLPSNKMSAVQRKIKDIGTVLEPERDKLIWQDFDPTREKLFPICPKCGERYPNTDEFWALIQYSQDTYQKKWLFCKQCAEEEYARGNEK